MRRIVPLVLLALATAACAGVAEPPEEPATTTTSAAETTTTTEAPDALPADWVRCENAVHAYSVGHPADWHTASLAADTECRWFDPDPFALEEATEAPIVALEVRQSEAEYRAVAGQPGPAEELLFEEPVEVAGHEAVVRETRAEAGAFYPEGTRIYAYLIDRDGRLFLVQTVALPELSEDRYLDHREVVDRAVETLRFTG